MSEPSDSIPAEDVTHAVENALWVAATTRHVGMPPRPFTDVFCAQLETHWNALNQLHGQEGGSSSDHSEHLTLGEWQ